MNRLIKERYDYFLIWGHGIKYRDVIIEIIESDRSIEILAIKHHKPKRLNKLIKTVYSYDYAPFKHLENKTKYLLTTKPEVIFVFVKNNSPREYLTSGSSLFIHVESDTIKKLKEIIRNKFNERKDDRRTEDHVVHASDNQSQTDYILKYLGFRNGVKLFENVPNSLLRPTYHLNKFNNFILKKVSLSNIYCSISINERDHKLLNVDETPHYLFLKGRIEPYMELRELHDSFDSMTDDKYPQTYSNFAYKFNYLLPPYSTSYILAKQIDDEKFQVIDGVHRICILKYQQKENLIIGVI
ncbi:hypothetical protein ACFLRR_02475 [Bacteroidota bacterium]